MNINCPNCNCKLVVIIKSNKQLNDQNVPMLTRQKKRQLNKKSNDSVSKYSSHDEYLEDVRDWCWR